MRSRSAGLSIAGRACNQPGFEALGKVIPAYHGYDQQHHILVVEQVPFSQSLHEQCLAPGRFLEEIAEALGETFGAYHVITSGMLERQPDLARVAIFPKASPWVLALHQMPHAAASMSGANAHLIRILQSYPEFPQHFEALRNGWRIEALIHGDVK